METLTEKRVYTVSELTRNIRLTIEKSFSEVWVEGEISNLKKYQSGHTYFSIKDEGSVIAAVLFKGAAKGVKFEPKDGMKAVFFGRVGVYDKRGQYQLYVEKIEPKGIGALQIAFEQLKEKLKNEGLFDESRKRTIPFLPKRVGVVTSPTGAAIRDILNVAQRRFSNIEIILNPVRVQGAEAKKEIVEALDVLNKIKNIDVIIVGRGGGSLEDLWPFNEEIVVRAIYRSRIPVISAVGHEIDWTISDFVADKRAPTPSAAAELVIPKKEELISLVKGLSDRMSTSLISRSDFLNEKLDNLKNRYVMREPLNIITQYKQEVDDLANDLVTQGGFLVKFKKESLNTLSGKLNALSPLGILNRGYSITTMEKNGKIVKDSKRVNKKDIIRTRLAKGEIISEVGRKE